MGSVTTRKKKLYVHIRWMIRRDMPEVLAIEEACQLDFPWDEKAFKDCENSRDVIRMVAEVDERVVGFMVYETHQSRIHLLNLNVHPSMWRRGVGRRMVEKLIGKLSAQRRTRITAEISETNLDAHLFFRAMGFKATAVLHDYYDCANEDCYLFQFRVEQ